MRDDDEIFTIVQSATQQNISFRCIQHFLRGQPTDDDEKAQNFSIFQLNFLEQHKEKKVSALCAREMKRNENPARVVIGSEHFCCVGSSNSRFLGWRVEIVRTSSDFSFDKEVVVFFDGGLSQCFFLLKCV